MYFKNQKTCVILNTYKKLEKAFLSKISSAYVYKEILFGNKVLIIIKLMFLCNLLPQLVNNN